MCNQWPRFKLGNPTPQLPFLHVFDHFFPLTTGKSFLKAKIKKHWFDFSIFNLQKYMSATPSKH